MKLAIKERLSDANRTIIDTDSDKGEGYRFVGRRESLYEFVTGDGRSELFARRKGSLCGWHLLRGAYSYEFVRSVWE